jgi:hypothetical protein
MDPRGPLRQHAVARHGKEDARLAVLEDQKHRRHGHRGGPYFVNHQNMRRPSVEFFSFTTRQRAHIATLPNRVAEFGSNLTISPDRSHLLVVLVDEISADIMLVENFH